MGYSVVKLKFNLSLVGDDLHLAWNQYIIKNIFFAHISLYW